MSDSNKHRRTDIEDLQNSWTLKPLEQMFDFFSGMPLSRSALGNQGAFYLHYGDIHKRNQSVFDTHSDAKWLPKLDIDVEGLCGKNLLHTGDVVFADASEDYEGIGKSIVVRNDDSLPFVAGLHTIVAKDNKALLDNDFKKYCFSTAMVRKQFIKLATGATVYSISKNNIKNIKILTPPLPEQRKIAAILTSVDDAITATQRIIDQTEVVKRGLMQHLLTKGTGHSESKETDIGRIPAEWEVVRLGDVADFINGRGFKPHEWSTSGYPIIRIQNLNGTSEFNYYDGEFNDKILVEPGTLLFAWSGSRGTSFGPHIWKGPRGVLNYHTWRVEESSALIRQYLYFSLVKLTTQIENDSHGASALVHMQKAYVVDYKIPLPSFEEQKEISCILQEYDKKRANEIQTLLKLQELKQALMQVLLTGKVRVNTDEPSEVHV